MTTPMPTHEWVRFAEWLRAERQVIGEDVDVQGLAVQYAVERRTPEREQFLRDVMCTALEGGVGYWSVADEIKRSGTPEERRDVRYDWHYISYRLTEYPEGEGCSLDDDARSCPGHLVDVDVIERGLARFETAQLRDDLKQQLRAGNAENDGGGIDADGADVLVQLGIFGDVVYA